MNPPLPQPEVLAMQGAEPEGLIDDDRTGQFVAQMADAGHFDGRRVLAIIPDDTRTAPISAMFRHMAAHLRPRVAGLDYLIALGTHPPMSEEKITRLMGLDPAAREAVSPGSQVLNHRWDIEGTLVEIGRIPAGEMAAITGGLIEREMSVTVNRLLLEYDCLLIIGPTFPHEVIGFSGGNKYFFPGVSGGDMINFTHWLGALCTIPEIIGRKDTLVRRVIDRAAEFIPTDRRCLSMVVTRQGLAGLFFGVPEAAFGAAADLSSTRHIVTVDRRYKTVLALAPEMYDELWVAGKCMYKLMQVVEPGGRLIIHGKHIDEVSRTHGEWICKVGYHVKDYFLNQWERFRDVPGSILAHSAHVRGLGRFECGVEQPDIEVILATSIPEALCREINLGYMDPDTVRVEDYAGREAEGVLVVPKAGEYLYRLKG